MDADLVVGVNACLQAEGGPPMTWRELCWCAAIAESIAGPMPEKCYVVSLVVTGARARLQTLGQAGW